MLEITVKASDDFYDQEKNLFHKLDHDEHLRLEHSLISISKWESKYHRSFLSDGPKNVQETIDYIRYMSITSNVDPEAFYVLSAANMKEINDYIEDPMTATTFHNNLIENKRSSKVGNQVLTSEIIYYLMISYNIPFECQKWHLNRLLMLLKVCEYKNAGPGSKMTKSEIYAQNKALNAARRAKYHTKG